MLDATITGPDGGVTRDYFFDPGYSFKTERPDNTVSERAYDVNTPPGMGFPALNVNQYVRYEFLTTTGVKTAINEFKLDKNGNPTQVKEYDWVYYSSVPRDASGKPTGTGGATPVRVTVNTYYSPTPDASDSSTLDPDIYSKVSFRQGCA